MYPVFPASPAAVRRPPRGGFHPDVLETVQAELARLDPGLDPRSPRGQMAVLVIAAAATGRNIDRLARITRIERETVAKFCRRLFDAGIDPAEMGQRDFWSVVALAEGRGARPAGDGGGGEWGPADAGPRDAEDARGDSMERAEGRPWTELFPDAEWLT